ncbi:hypothetical protein OTU49_004002 [Cherax quadricarinatus]|uniref:Secreted protein n=1 Tax=Cherax quadricarinatus TaxID=27406 RepID=A0AAW0XG04_CHEQU
MVIRHEAKKVLFLCLVLGQRRVECLNKENSSFCCIIHDLQRVRRLHFQEHRVCLPCLGVFIPEGRFFLSFPLLSNDAKNLQRPVSHELLQSNSDLWDTLQLTVAP